jgi:hypothetical protein
LGQRLRRTLVELRAHVGERLQRERADVGALREAEVEQREVAAKRVEVEARAVRVHELDRGQSPRLREHGRGGGRRRRARHHEHHRHEHDEPDDENPEHPSEHARDYRTTSKSAPCRGAGE